MGKMKGIRPHQGAEPYMFISYAHADQERVEEICSALYQLRYRIWFDEGIQPGKNWSDMIAERIQASACMLAFVSEAYLKSDHCLDELYYAIDSNAEFVIIYLDQVELPGGIAMRARRKQAILAYEMTNMSESVAKIVQIEGIGICREKDSSTISRKQVTFFELESGEHAVSAVFCREWMEQSADSLLVIWGSDGKALLKFKYALENWCREKEREFESYYAEEWINLYISFLSGRTTVNFKEQILEPKILIMDNIDFLTGKTSTQEELFYMIRKRSDLGKITVLLGFHEYAPNAHRSRFFKEMDAKLKKILQTGAVVDLDTNFVSE